MARVPREAKKGVVRASHRSPGSLPACAMVGRRCGVPCAVCGRPATCPWAGAATPTASPGQGAAAEAVRRNAMGAGGRLGRVSSRDQSGRAHDAGATDRRGAGVHRKPYLSIGTYGPYPERLRQQFSGMIWRFRTGGQWREMPAEFGAWPTVHNRFRQWRDAGVLEALLEGLIAEAAEGGEVDLSLVSEGSTTARAHHDAAGMHLAPEVLAALEKAAGEEEKDRSKGAARRDRTGTTATATPPGKSDAASGQNPAEGRPAWAVARRADQQGPPRRRPQGPPARAHPDRPPTGGVRHSSATAHQRSRARRSSSHRPVRQHAGSQAAAISRTRCRRALSGSTTVRISKAIPAPPDRFDITSP